MFPDLFFLNSFFLFILAKMIEIFQKKTKKKLEKREREKEHDRVRKRKRENFISKETNMKGY